MDGCLEWTAQMTLVYALVVVVVVSPGCLRWVWGRSHVRDLYGG